MYVTDCLQIHVRLTNTEHTNSSTKVMQLALTILIVDFLNGNVPALSIYIRATNQTFHIGLPFRICKKPDHFGI